MRYAMMEPLFTEFADECLKIVEPEKPNDSRWHNFESSLHQHTDSKEKYPKHNFEVSYN